MSTFIIVGAAALAEGITEMALHCLDKAKYYAACYKFKRSLRARRERRFVV